MAVEAITTVLLERLCSTVTTQCQFVTDVGADIDWLRDELRSLHSLLQDADGFAEDEKQNQNQNAVMSAWVNGLRDAMYDSEDVIESFQLLQSGDLTSYVFHLKSRYEIGLQIRRIRSTLAEVHRRKSDFVVVDGAHSKGDGLVGSNWLHNRLQASPLVYDGELIGVEKDFDMIHTWTLDDEKKQLSVLAVIGMGGVGKTTLVKKLFNHRDVKKQFERCTWIYVSPSIRLRDLFVGMVKGLMGIPSAAASALDEAELQEMLLNGLLHRRYLVVLDDVWDVDLWRAVSLVLPKEQQTCSRVIITTRKREVASSVTEADAHIHHLQPLSREESWALFCKKAFGTTDAPEELTKIAGEITRKCDGLPLALVTTAGMMSRKERTELEWKRVLDGIPRDLSNDVRRALFLSYKDLPFILKPCFLYCSAFPPDSEISRKRVVRLWIAEGLICMEDGRETVEDVAEKYLMELIGRSMLQVSKVSSSGKVKAFRVHDLLHQLSISKSEKEGFLTIFGDQNTSLPNKIRRISVQNDAVLDRGKLRRVRSYFLFNKTETCCFTPRLSKHFEMLRVLDLEEAVMMELPSEVGSLIHLRYLCVKGTEIENLPKSIQNLVKLQTLDVRKTRLSRIPFGLANLKQLRHLEMGQIGQSILVPSGLGCLDHLQDVTGLEVTDSTIHELFKLTQLKKLGVGCENTKIISDLCPIIAKMKNLSSLSMICRESVEHLDLKSLSLLKKLHLLGSLGIRLPESFSSLYNLTKLRMVLSRLNDDPMPVLGMLPNLTFLQLYEAYRGKVMRCRSPGFSKLKILGLTWLEKLEELVIEEGALACIQELWIMSCSMLSAVPSGFELLTTVNKLRLVGMPISFLERLDPSLGEDYPKVKHVPTIQVID